MIGNEALANFICDAVRDMPTDEWNELTNNDMPEGWTYLGSGAWRHAILGPDGCVYKVSICAGDEINEEQYHMWNDTLRHITLARGVRFAAMDYFAESNVQVCEYVRGEYPEWNWEQVSAFSQRIREQTGGLFLDLNRRNIIVTDDGMVIVDF